jgi:hypothetical protein
MKNIALIFFLFIAFQASAQEDYTIQIGDSIYKISLNSQYNLTINGKKVPVSVKMNDTLSYSDEFISFKYPKGFSVSKTTIEEGVEQVTIMTAEGSGIMIQKYSTFDPSPIQEMLLTEVTKESVNYGFVKTRHDYFRTLASGHKADVKKAILKYKDETNIYEVTSIGKKDEGLLLLTVRMDDTKGSIGDKLIALLWQTLRFK